MKNGTEVGLNRLGALHVGWVLALLASGLGAAAQEVVVLKGPPTCSECRVVAELSGSIGGHSDGLSGWPTSIARDSRGRYYLTIPEVEQAPLVYDERGSFLLTLGREGSGPGEFRAAHAIHVSDGDTVIVLDRRNSRLSVLSPEYQFVRSAVVPANAQVVVRLPGGDFAVNAAIRDAARIGFPLQRYSAEGEHVRSFGAVRPKVLPGDVWGDLRRIALSHAGGLWSAVQVGRYAFEHWSAEGERLAEFTREVGWFPDYGRAWDLTPGRPPYPRLRGIWEDGDGRVWIIAQVPDREWEEGVGAVRRIEGKAIYRITDPTKAYDTIVEVVDLSAGRLLASTRFDGVLTQTIIPGLVGEVRENADLTFRVDVWRLSLQH